ncbi:MAG: hypothetical protein ABI689_04140 [Thermoanaerobaculia bacterium]
MSSNRRREWLLRLASRFVSGSPGQELLGRLDYYVDPELRLSWGGALNGQAGRRVLLEELFRAASFDAVVETGTYHGTTTRYLAELARAQVVTIERDPRHCGFARQALRDLTSVQVCLGDSERSLPPLLASLAERSSRPFVYLDAHWGPALPLAVELSLTFGALRHAVAAVDDFRVPGDTGYGFDDYGPGATLDLETFAPLFSELGLTPFFPTLPSAEESGMRRGVVLLAAADDELALLRRMPLLRERPLRS